MKGLFFRKNADEMKQKTAPKNTFPKADDTTD